MVTYLSGNRIQGVSNAALTGKIAGTAGSGSQYTDWTRTSGTVLNGRDNLSYDLGATINDTQWIMRFKLYINAFTLNHGSGCHVCIGMSSHDAETALDTSQDSISFAIQFASSASEQNFKARNGSDSGMAENSVEIGTNMLTGSAGKTYYVEIKRTSETAGTVSVTENSDYTTSTTSANLTSLTSSVSGLRYFVSKLYDGQNNAVDNHVYANVSEVKLYDNQSSPTTVTYDIDYFMRSTSGWNINNTSVQNIIPIETDEKVALLTNSPLETRYEETDTSNIFRKKADLVSGTDLKVYIKFDDASGNPANKAGDVAGSSGHLGSAADITLAGTGTMDYQTTGLPSKLSTGMEFPSTSITSGRYGNFGTSTSQFNFMWKEENGNAPTWSMCFWAKQSASVIINTALMKNENGEGTKGFELYWANESGTPLAFKMKNGLSGMVTGRPFEGCTFTDWSTDGSWHFYTFTLDGGASSNHLKITRDQGTTQQWSKTAGVFATTGDANHKLQWKHDYDGAYITPTTSYAELSIWSRVLTDAELTTLYNSGNGFQLDTGLDVWKEKDT